MNGRVAKIVSLEVAPLVIVILIPLTVHAGVLSAMLGVLGTDVIAYDADEHEVAPSDVKLLSSQTNADPNAALGGGDIIIDEGSLVPGGAFGENAFGDSLSSGEISIHTVRPCTESGCETLSHIAEMYGVSVNTILWANNISDPDVVQPGDELVILPITGVRHVVKDGETLTTIAKKYGAQSDEDINALVDEIVAYNRIEGIAAGDTIVVPGGVIHTAAPKQVAKSAAPAKASGAAASSGSAGGFTHPLPGAVRSQGIHGYNGVDLAGVALGSSVRAAAAGEVIVSRASGWNGGYGNYVVVKHANGTQTLYAHLNSVAVGVGDYVASGQTLGGVGNTGRSTGIHLHFEVRGASNPF